MMCALSCDSSMNANSRLLLQGLQRGAIMSLNKVAAVEADGSSVLLVTRCIDLLAGVLLLHTDCRVVIAAAGVSLVL